MEDCAVYESVKSRLTFIFEGREVDTMAYPRDINKRFIIDEFKKHFGIDNIFKTHLLYTSARTGDQKNPVLYSDDILALRKHANYCAQTKLFVELKPKSESGNYNSDHMIVPSDEWSKLLESLERLEISIRGKEEPKIPFSETVHCGIVCDGCQEHGVQTFNSLTTDASGYIRGPRFKCIYCPDYDLCYKCEAEGFFSGTHKPFHNFVKITTPDVDLANFSTSYACSLEKSSNKLPEIKPSGFYSKSFNDGGAGFSYFKEMDQFSPDSFIQSDQVPEPRQEVDNEVSSDNNQFTGQYHDVVIEVEQKNKAMFDFFSELKTEEQLTALMQDAISWRVATKWYGETIYENLERYESLKKRQVEEALKKDAEVDEQNSGISRAIIPNPSIRVEMTKKDHLLTFKLHNDGNEVVPNRLKLVFQCYKEGQASAPIKCNLQMGPNELQPGNFKILNFNYRGIMEEFSFDYTCKIDLIDMKDQVIYTTNDSKCASSVFHLTPPTYPHCKKFGYEDMRYDSETDVTTSNEAMVLPSKLPLEDDIISTTVTDQEEYNVLVQVDSELEEYDLLSDSDLECENDVDCSVP